MELRIYRPLWGYTGSAEEAVEELEDSVFDGIEADFPETAADKASLISTFQSGEVPLIVDIFVDGKSRANQLDLFRARLEEVAVLGPDRIVVHAGQDFWPTSECVAYYEGVVDIELDLNIRTSHETHRRRPLGTPWMTSAVLSAVPDLHLCCDFSHWVLVCERILEDQLQVIEQAAQRATHVHGRVGSEQAPQVQDPADPRVAGELAAFEQWWDLVWDSQLASGAKLSTFTPEYGPPPYQQITGDPSFLAERLSAICTWQATRAKERFERRLAR